MTGTFILGTSFSYLLQASFTTSFAQKKKETKWIGNDSLGSARDAWRVVYETTRGLLFVLIDNERRNKERRAATRVLGHCACQCAPVARRNN